jgi:4-hydroxythreonine-4-phosphate dehydrogenase
MPDCSETTGKALPDHFSDGFLSTPVRTICMTVGDPTGIGPEIMARFLHWRHECQRQEPPPTSIRRHRLVIFGDIPQLAQEAEKLGLGLPEASSDVRYVNIRSRLAPSVLDSETYPGRIAHDSLEAAVAEIAAGRSGQRADVLVTGPIAKENLQRAGLPFSGHTEILQHLAQQAYGAAIPGKAFQSDMLFLYGAFRMLLLTRHVALRRVSETLSVPGVTQSLDSLCLFLRERCGIPSPRLCILGVNPHAGELEGEEETRILKPALAAISQKYDIEIEPPAAADAVFRGFDAARPLYDAYVAAYHDQGLIPFKMAAGFKAVNVTIGLPFLRTSVSHGTAPDIAGKGIADPDSLICAYQAAIDLSETFANKPIPTPTSSKPDPVLDQPDGELTRPRHGQSYSTTA